MKLSSIEIKNFKSIEEITIPVRSYGEDMHKSNTLIMIGVNECGKSNILEAIKLAGENFASSTYKQLKCKHHQEKPDYKYIDVYFNFECNTQKKIQEILGKYQIPKELTQSIEISYIYKNVWLTAEDSGHSSWRVITSLSNQIDISTFWYHQNTITQFPNLPDSNYERLTIEKFEIIIGTILTPYFESLFPKIIFWKADPSYLINESISLSDFMEDTTLSIPLRNIFHLNGQKDDDSIKESILTALNDEESRAELKDALSDAATTYINNIWKEHKINIKVEMNGDNCSVMVEDKGVAHKYYSMDKRSDGFKQFISLILSLSTENVADKLKNAIILLDEPEVHLHPSGIRYMRDELLKIGKNNYVFITTHSNYMVDTEVIERHAIIEKAKITKFTPMQRESNIYSDEVLGRAFGLNIMKELLPEKLLIVEGGSDKKIIEHALRLLHPNLQFILKPAGGCTKMPTMARFVHNETIKAIFLFDDDDEGRTECKKIIDAKVANKEAAFTLKKICDQIVEKGTIEDLLNRDWICSVCKNEKQLNVTLKDDQPVLCQIRAQIPNLKKEQLESLKIKISEQFVTDYKKEKIETDCPLLVELINELFKIIRQ